MRQNLPLHWVCEKGEKEKEIPSFFSAVISLITSLAKGHSINKNVLFVRFMCVTLKVIYETEVCSTSIFFSSRRKQIPDGVKDGGEENLPDPDSRQQQRAQGCSSRGMPWHLA